MMGPTPCSWQRSARPNVRPASRTSSVPAATGVGMFDTADAAGVVWLDELPLEVLKIIISYLDVRSGLRCAL